MRKKREQSRLCGQLIVDVYPRLQVVEHEFFLSPSLATRSLALSSLSL